MERNLLLLLPNPTATPSLVLPIQRLAFRNHSCFSTQKTAFFGKSLILSEKTVNLFGPAEKTRVPLFPVRAVVKRRKEHPFDDVIQRDKKLKLVFKIRKILVSQPDRTMSLKDLGRYRRDLGLTNKSRLIALLKNFPAVFEIVQEGVFSLKFRLTPEADKLYEEELQAKNEMEELSVMKLRKLLMMSLEKRILLSKIVRLRNDLGLPFDFSETICHQYPQYFRVVVTREGPALELTHWDPELAVSAAELSEGLELNRVALPKGLNLSRSEMKYVCKFRDMPYISPYSDFSMLRQGSLKKEKHACGVVHELLSLTIEKRTIVDNLTHFREEFRFSQQVRGMLIRHQDMFYVSIKGARDSVFLRDGYLGSQLTETDRQSIIKEKLRSLVAVLRRRGTLKAKAHDFDDEGAPGEDQAGELEWSDIDGYLSDDDWTEDDDLPPDFDEDEKNEDMELNIDSKRCEKNAPHVPDLIDCQLRGTLVKLVVHLMNS